METRVIRRKEKGPATQRPALDTTPHTVNTLSIKPVPQTLNSKLLSSALPPAGSQSAANGFSSLPDEWY